VEEGRATPAPAGDPEGPTRQTGWPHPTGPRTESWPRRRPAGPGAPGGRLTGQTDFVTELRRRRLIRAPDDLEACCAAHDGYQIADVHAWRGDKDAALRWLERSRDRHDGGVTFLKYDPLMPRLRGDPRLAAYLASVRLPPER
jgi:hypothetical protein